MYKGLGDREVKGGTLEGVGSSWRGQGVGGRGWGAGGGLISQVAASAADLHAVCVVSGVTNTYLRQPGSYFSRIPARAVPEREGPCNLG